ncbi:hypothetical protein NBRC116592_10310 [Colwellia sp. KU-HH00111]|uniref:extracellular catalytic domain type 1 short-chain-length polyhydroxyalkanoate depolymerase n=1 Tax=Colwellia sp. KU-HH00111 TaxID=3127652 RepID=UPI003104D146
MKQLLFKKLQNSKSKIIPGALISLCLSLSPQSMAGSWQQNVSIGGFNNVHIYTPDSNSSIGTGKSLLIVLHGCVQPIDNFLTANLEDAAEEHGMVIAVPDAMNKAGFNCWSYWQGAVSRTAGDYKNLINLANTMSGDANREIDPKQVYIAGLSSGSAMTAQTACLAPDVFAGVSPNAGPSIGTSASGAGSCETVSPSTFKSRCESYAGSAKDHLSTQLAVVGHGTQDTTVPTCYNQQNANGYAQTYGVNQLPGTNTISEGSGHTASETLWSNGQLSMLWFNNLDHSWSGGAGASGSYIDDSSINVASYLGKFFAENNKRVDRNAGPVISNFSVIEDNNALTITGDTADAEGSVASVNITIASLASGTPSAIQTISATLANDDSYSASSISLVDGLYQVTAVATDNEGKAGDSVSMTIYVGTPPPPAAPELSGINASVSGQCATITGTVIDQNLNLSSVVVSFANDDITATVNGNQYTAEKCSLPGGSNTATVTASDSTSLTSVDSVQFTIDAGVTGNYNLHINEGHITWGSGYSACYLEFGTADFTMREYPTGNEQCNWIADGAPSCAGPNQACLGGGTTNTDNDNDGILNTVDNCPDDANSDQLDSDSDGLGNVCDPTPYGSTFSCTETTASNYSHVQANRATTNGAYVYAIGSGESMGFYNIFSTATLAETSENYYEVGNCP